MDFSGISTPFAPSLPPSHAIMSRRWILRGFNPFVPSYTSLVCKCKLEVVFAGFRRCSHPLHLPHVQERAGGGFWWGFDPFSPPPPPQSDPESSSTAIPSCHPIRTATASPVSKIELEVGFMAISTPFAPLPPPLPARMSRRLSLWSFHPVRTCHCLTC